mgnify:CR=1 FL=1
MDTYIYLLITMAFSAFFSGMEIAFVSVDKLRFEMERKEGLTSRILSYFFRNSNSFISTMLVGNNIALVIYGILMAQVIKVHLLGDLISNDFVEVYFFYYLYLLFNLLHKKGFNRVLFPRKIVFLEELLKRIPLYITLKITDCYDGKNTGHIETMYPTEGTGR